MFNLGRGVLPEAREFEKGVKLMRYDLVKGGERVVFSLAMLV